MVKNISIYIVMLLIGGLSIHSNISKLDRIKELNRELREQQADNENLRFQYNQCKILYRGM